MISPLPIGRPLLPCLRMPLAVCFHLLLSDPYLLLKNMKPLMASSVMARRLSLMHMPTIMRFEASGKTHLLTIKLSIMPYIFCPKKNMVLMAIMPIRLKCWNDEIPQGDNIPRCISFISSEHAQPSPWNGTWSKIDTAFFCCQCHYDHGCGN